jgi:hypothetical protein
MDIQKSYIYKVYRQGQYVGLLPNVTSKFEYEQDINSAGSSITITCGISGDTVGLTPPTIDDETGAIILDETGGSLTAEQYPEIIGDNSVFFKNGNQIVIFEISSYHPNGIQVFSGDVEKWNSEFGVDNEEIELTVYSDGQDLNNYVINTGDSAYITQNTSNGHFVEVKTTNTPPFTETICAQTFIMDASKVMGSFDVKIDTYSAGNLTVKLYRQIGSSVDTNNDTLLTYGRKSIGIVGGSVQNIKLLSPTTLTTGLTYYILVTWSSSTSAYLYTSDASPYATGNMWTMGYQWPSYYNITSVTGTDIYFVVYEHGGNTTVAYTSKDPGYILNDIMNSYVDSGGAIKIPQAITPLISMPINDTVMPTGSWASAYAQIIETTEDITINGIQLWLGVSSGSCGVYVQLCEGDPSLDSLSVIGGTTEYTMHASNTLIETISVVVTSTTIKDVAFKFANSHTLESGTQYYILMWFEGAITLQMYGASSANVPVTYPYIGDQYYRVLNSNNSSGGMAHSDNYPALYINMFYTDLALEDIVSGYKDIGVTATYQFKLATVFEGIKKCLELSPYNWYFYVDLGDNKLYFKETSTTAIWTIAKGKHINTLKLCASTENIKNLLYFSGGIPSGETENLMGMYQDADSITNNKSRLDLISDNRVTVQATMDTLGNASVDYTKDEAYQTEVTILDSTVDISQYKLGDTVKFSGFGSFVDGLIIQIVRISYSPSKIILTLGQLPPRTSQTLKAIQNQLVALETLNNPATTS